MMQKYEVDAMPSIVVHTNTRTHITALLRKWWAHTVRVRSKERWLKWDLKTVVRA